MYDASPALLLCIAPYQDTSIHETILKLTLSRRPATTFMTAARIKTNNRRLKCLGSSHLSLYVQTFPRHTLATRPKSNRKQGPACFNLIGRLAVNSRNLAPLRPGNNKPGDRTRYAWSYPYIISFNVIDYYSSSPRRGAKDGVQGPTKHICLTILTVRLLCIREVVFVATQ